MFNIYDIKMGKIAVELPCTKGGTLTVYLIKHFNDLTGHA